MVQQITGGSNSSSYSEISNVEIFDGTLNPVNTYFLSLHNGAPGTTGTELTVSAFPSYQRQPVSFAAPAPGYTAQYNNSLVSFSELTATGSGFYIGLWESQYGKDYLIGSTAVVCGAVAANQALQFALNTIVYSPGALSASGALVNPHGGSVYGTVRYGTSYYGEPTVGSGNVLALYNASPVTQSTSLYSEINLGWTAPNVITASVVSNSSLVQVLVRNVNSLPMDVNDGIQVMNEPQSGPTYFTDSTLSSNSRGSYIYYSLFLVDTSMNWHRAADWQVMLPFPYDFGPWMFSLVPSYFQELDSSLNVSLDYDINGLPYLPNPQVAATSDAGSSYDSGVDYDDV